MAAYMDSPFSGMAALAMPTYEFAASELANRSSSMVAAAAANLSCVQHLPKRALTCGNTFQAGNKRSIACSNPAAATCQQPEEQLQHVDMDLDTLLAAAAAKPGYYEPTTTAAAAEAAAAAAAAQAAYEAAAVAAAEARRAASAAAAKAAAVSGVLQQYSAIPIASGSAGGIGEAAAAVIAESGLCDTFYVYDLGEVARLHATWCATMPRVLPFYAVKCNPEPGMVAMLNALGAGFDCASIQELNCAAAHNVPQSRIIFANPCKRPADFRYARENGVEYTTFDCASELEKIAAGYPEFKCVLRIRCDDAEAKINLGLKYGADLKDVPMLLGMAKNLGLQVVGVSFHVGSGCQNVGVYADAIVAAREAFDIAAGYGFNMELLDIGGGFTAPYDELTGRLFYETAGVINGALARWFPPECGVRVIAEPGRYFAETSATLFTTILGQRDSRCPDGRPFKDYWLSDGTYGSFRIQVAVDGLEPNYSVLRSPLLPPPTADEASQLLPCRLWGNSDRDGDVVHKAALLPPLRDGDWLMFPYAGAYTICAASNYGGVCFTQPMKIFVCSSEAVREFGGFDVAAGIAAAAAGASSGSSSRHGVHAAAAVCETGSVAASCSDDSMAGCEQQLLPCVELLQELAFEQLDSQLAGNNKDNDTELTELSLAAAQAQDGTDSTVLGGIDVGSCLDLGELDVSVSRADSPEDAADGDIDSGAAVAAAGGYSGSKGGDGGLLHAAGSNGSCDNFDCMSVASEGTTLGVGGTAEGEMEVSSVVKLQHCWGSACSTAVV